MIKLSRLYLQLIYLYEFFVTGYLYKANAAYSRAQATNPAYINCWTGQSLIAEMMGKGEAIDLFRCATQLGCHSEAAIGYTHHLLNTMLNSSSKFDNSVSHVTKRDYPLHDAVDVMTWYIGEFLPLFTFLFIV